MNQQFDEDYYMNGVQTGKSLYENYRWLPELTVPMCDTIANYCGIDLDDTILDFGCARGYSVKAFRQLGYEAYGQDISSWAISNSDEEIKNYLKCQEHITTDVDWIIAKDVLEHIAEVDACIVEMLRFARGGIFVAVPLAEFDNEQYVVPEYEQDATHIHRLTLASWAKKFLSRGLDVKLSYRIPGIKDNRYCETGAPGDGFIIATRS